MNLFSSRSGIRLSEAFSLLCFCALMVCSSGNVIASCGDYLMPLGDAHGANANAGQFDLSTRSSLSDWIPVKPWCHGPSCQGVPSSTGVTALPAPRPDSNGQAANVDSGEFFVSRPRQEWSPSVDCISLIYRSQTIFRPPIFFL